MGLWPSYPAYLVQKQCRSLRFAGHSSGPRQTDPPWLLGGSHPEKSWWASKARGGFTATVQSALGGWLSLWPLVEMERSFVAVERQGSGIPRCSLVRDQRKSPWASN